ncbi:MAG: DUF72 domain-containing protein [Candidatus Brocadia sp. AMX2]|uniref:Uncharacterized conserved protein n=1 Tax=Candidatus Brocadia sinica JPN1 TaxID=1197129 RepID=A0ABQ0JTJ0_9BACT|nr:MULTISPECIES: DUF72 domain-containing protein [Brocadia]KXK25498.1 MAG: hypothetical protein UZ01_03302 [Candidatus Brocadia sinica]MBC6931998.1 DUF72 domain-containing protein [Candidatus Brocadia sp.]MBL1168239.1 DUF72 domain-containing protein [Candidatus Brocadia sp. AMX1]NOG39990.1 DUF72 domain-containing protein [Planctomycetota bacterium]KAA0243502.1 MAG: DUF72 domain-containing protein [Candidatus Brocadia sp. AMX2]
MIQIGCCGFPVARQKYFDTFRVVELQQTFYQPPLSSTIQKWRNEAPPDFEYTLKAWQLITHEPSSPTYRRLKINIPQSKEKNYGSFKPTDEVYAAWEKTKAIADTLHAKVIVFQCPASFEPTGENKSNLKRFFYSMKSDRYIFAWEPRGRWGKKEIKTICKELNLIHCVDPFKSKPTFGSIRYYRLHGIGGYRYKYTQEDMNTLKNFVKEKIDIDVMFNNISMYDDALAFKRFFL